MNKINKKMWAAVLTAGLLVMVTNTACTQNKNNAATETEQIEVSVDELKALAEVLPKYEYVCSFHDGLARVSDKETSLYGFIDKTGKEVIPCQYEDADDFADGVTSVLKDDQRMIIDREGNVVATINADYQHGFQEGLMAFLVTDGEGEHFLGYVDMAGKVVIPADKYRVILTERDNFYDFSDGLCRVMDFDNYRNFFIDKTGKKVFDCDGYAEDFHEGLAAVGSYNEKTDEFLHGFIDKTGKKVIPNKFTAVGDFRDGLCCAFGEGKAGFIDKEGKWVITGDYKLITLYEEFDDSYPLCSTFSDGLAWMCNKEGKFGYIDKEGNVVIPFRYEPGKDEWSYTDQPVFDFHQGLARVWDKATGKYGYIDKEGNEVFPYEFDFAEDVSEGVAIVQKGDQFGFINTKGNSTFDFAF